MLSNELIIEMLQNVMLLLDALHRLVLLPTCLFCVCRLHACRSETMCQASTLPLSHGPHVPLASCTGEVRSAGSAQRLYHPCSTHPP